MRACVCLCIVPDTLHVAVDGKAYSFSVDHHHRRSAERLGSRSEDVLVGGAGDGLEDFVQLRMHYELRQNKKHARMQQVHSAKLIRAEIERCDAAHMYQSARLVSGDGKPTRFFFKHVGESLQHRRHSIIGHLNCPESEGLLRK